MLSLNEQLVTIAPWFWQNTFSVLFWQFLISLGVKIIFWTILTQTGPVSVAYLKINCVQNICLWLFREWQDFKNQVTSVLWYYLDSCNWRNLYFGFNAELSTVLQYYHVVFVFLILKSQFLSGSFSYLNFFYFDWSIFRLNPYFE